jgi:ABC-type branched-subunit amino acid transport system ATPase component
MTLFFGYNVNCFIGNQTGLFYTTNPVFYTSGNTFFRRTGTFGNLIFSLVPSDNRNTRTFEMDKYYKLFPDLVEKIH